MKQLMSSFEITSLDQDANEQVENSTAKVLLLIVTG